MTNRPRLQIESAAWVAAVFAATFVLVGARAQIGPAHVALAYLMIVLGCSARCGRYAGLLVAAICFLAFNFFFVRPFGTLAVHDPFDWLILVAFLAASAIAAELLDRAQREAQKARDRADEIQRLATLGADALQAPRAIDALGAIARVVRDELKVGSAEIYLREGEHLRLAATSAAASHSGIPAEEVVLARDFLLRGDARTLILPLLVQDHQVGLLLLRSDAVISPQVAEHSFVKALAHYAAIGLERVRLSAAAAVADSLKESEKLKDAVLSAVSHDLRTPLTSIKAVAHEIANSGDSRGAAIELNADRLNRYVTNLLDLSLLNAGGFKVTRELVPLEDIIGAALREVSPFSGGRMISAKVSSESGMPAGTFDFVLTLRALTNVLENAIRYSDADSPIEVWGMRNAKTAELTVADRGRGLSDDDAARLFQPFQRGTAGSSVSGSGLGLATARRLIESQGGTLSFSKRPGGGTLFTISLPAESL